MGPYISPGEKPKTLHPSCTLTHTHISDWGLYTSPCLLLHSNQVVLLELLEQAKHTPTKDFALTVPCIQNILSSNTDAVLLPPSDFCLCCPVLTQSCPTLWDPVDCSPPGSSVYGASPGRNAGVGCHALLLREIFPTQGLNPGLTHGSQILLPSEPAGKPKNTEADNLSLLQGSSQPRSQAGVSCTARRFFISWTPREAPIFA